jgi:transglutaminase superfamily protein
MTALHDPLPAKWRRFRMRPREDRALILRAALILPLIEVGLRWFGFRRCKRLLEKFSPAPRSSRPLPPAALRERALRAARAVRSAELHGPARPNCLERSLALWWLLRREGAESELHIGGRKEGLRFEAHAWVELGGKILNDAAEVHQHYARFDAPLAAAAAEHPATGKPDGL